MSGGANLQVLIQNMQPKLHLNEFVFTSQKSLDEIPISIMIGMFSEDEGVTVIMKKEHADNLGLSYEFIASWITLTIHSSLEAVGLTAAVSSELAKYGISCNVIAAYHHDHIFVNKKDGESALKILTELAKNYD